MRSCTCGPPRRRRQPGRAPSVRAGTGPAARRGRRTRPRRWPRPTPWPNSPTGARSADPSPGCSMRLPRPRPRRVGHRGAVPGRRPPAQSAATRGPEITFNSLANYDLRVKPPGLCGQLPDALRTRPRHRRETRPGEYLRSRSSYVAHDPWHNIPEVFAVFHCWAPRPDQPALDPAAPPGWTLALRFSRRPRSARRPGQPRRRPPWTRLGQQQLHVQQRPRTPRSVRQRAAVGVPSRRAVTPPARPTGVEG